MSEMPPKPHVLFVTTGLGIGGAETLLLEVAKGVQAHGMAVTIVALQGNNPLTPRFVGAGLEVIELGASNRLPPLAALWKLRGLIKKRRIGFVQGWMYHGNVLAYYASKWAGLDTERQTAFGIFGVWPDMRTYGPVTGAIAKHGARLSNNVSTTVYNAQAAAEDHHGRGYHAARCTVMGNCVDVEGFVHRPEERTRIRAELGLDPSTPVAIIAARNHPQKNWPGTLAGLSRVKNLHVLAVGHETQALPAQPRLHRLGPRSDMAALYSASDFFVLASAFGEGTSLAMSEAMSCSLPAITTDIGDNALFAAQAGFTVPVDDAAALKEKASVLSDDLALRTRLSKAARQCALDNFSATENVKPLLALYDKAMA
ncbi:MAG: glycosyltransferase [Pseudomonadota bacterium]